MTGPDKQRHAAMAETDQLPVLSDESAGAIMEVMYGLIDLLEQTYEVPSQRIRLHYYRQMLADEEQRNQLALRFDEIEQ